MLEIIGFVLAIAIGISLGMIGGGGSTLAVPVLVYLIGISPTMATGYSLFIIGATSLVGGVRYSMKGLVDFKIALAFGVPSIFSVYATRKFVIPAIPDSIIELGSFVLTKDTMLMALFALLMIAASYGMIKPSKNKPGQMKGPKFWGIVLLEGLVVGLLTGLVGAGGGFLIIPALVIVAGLPMHMAVGTSLFIIAAKSLIGFTGDISNYSIDWSFLGLFTALAIVGIFIGSRLSTKVNAGSLKKSFGWFVLVMGVFILGIEFLT
jgi:hypothetical protein